MNYFVDTYAIIEFLNGNERFAKYFKDKPITTILNLMELYYRILKEFGEKKAEEYYNRFLDNMIEFDNDDVKDAMKFRLKLHKKGRDFSYTDCIGYIVAKKKKIKFLTGDKEFKGLRNVKFVK